MFPTGRFDCGFVQRSHGAEIKAETSPSPHHPNQPAPERRSPAVANAVDLQLSGDRPAGPVHARLGDLRAHLRAVPRAVHGLRTASDHPGVLPPAATRRHDLARHRLPHPAGDLRHLQRLVLLRPHRHRRLRRRHAGVGLGPPGIAVGLAIVFFEIAAVSCCGRTTRWTSSPARSPPCTSTAWPSTSPRRSIAGSATPESWATSDRGSARNSARHNGVFN